jgi:hypothetical protein
LNIEEEEQEMSESDVNFDNRPTEEERNHRNSKKNLVQTNPEQAKS